MLTYFHYSLIRCKEKLEGVDLYDCMKIRHLSLAESFPDDIVNKQDLGFRMVHQMMDVIGFELMQKWNRYCSVCHGRKESHGPVSLVA